jgi:hypothetical protein
MADNFEEEKQKFLLDLTNSKRDLLQSYSIEIRSNKECVLLAIDKNSYELKYASEDLKKDKNIIRIAVQIDGGSFNYAHNDLKKDKEFVIELFKINKTILYELNKKMADDEYFLWHINEIKKINKSHFLMNCISYRIFEEILENPNYLDDFAPPVNYKPAKHS